jgi:glycosyltransferase involved in cell wall biosynthesis
VTASSFVREIFQRNAVSSEIVVQPYGHDLRWLDNYEGKTKSETIRLGYIGQIINAKGVHLILQALSLLPEILLKKFSLVVYGNFNHISDYEQWIQEMASRLPNVTFGGVYPHSDGARIFSEIDLLLIPSLWYDFPLIIFEAFATQTPVIATNLAGMAEAVSHGTNGLLFERGDEVDLARQLERIANDTGLLERLAGGVPPVKSNEEELDEFKRIYLGLIK